MEFIKRAGTIIFAITIVIWALLYFPRPASLEEAICEHQSKATEADETINRLKGDLGELQASNVTKDESIVERDQTIAALREQVAQLDSVSADHVAALEKLASEHDTMKSDSDATIGGLKVDLDEVKSNLASKEELIAECEERRCLITCIATFHQKKCARSLLGES